MVLKKYKSPKERVFKKPTATRLANQALFYLGRYAASEASLRRVLQNKIRRAAMQDQDFAADHQAQAALHEVIEGIVAKHIKSGIINDKEYAAMKVASLRRSGKSARRIMHSLTQKGIAAELIEDALAPEEGEDSAQIELAAACSHAKRRRLGPYRKESVNIRSAADEIKLKNKEVASMARAGFTYDVAKQVLGVLPEDIP